MNKLKNGSLEVSPPKAAPSVLHSATLMGVATLISRVMGLVREQVFAFLFGAGNATDAFNIAFRIPNLLRDLFAEGAMSAALVPTFTRARAEQGERRAWRLAGLVFRVLLVTVGVLALLGVVFAPQLVGFYASAYREVPGKFELTVAMTRTMFPFFPLVALAAAFMGILNACGVFFLPAFASALFNVASVATGVLLVFVFGRLAPEWGLEPIQGMAIGVVVGGAVQALCQVPQLYRVGYRWFKRDPALDLPWNRDPALRSMLWMMVPGTIGLAATQVNILVNSILATSQSPGAVSWLNYAFRLMQFPIGIFGVSLAAATLPTVSRLWVARDVQGVRKTLTETLGQVFAVNLPASAGLAFLAYPIIELIFQYGRFSASDTAATAHALMAYSVGLSAYSAVKVLVPACYALGNTRIPVISSVLSVALTIGLNLMTVRHLGYWGLALGTSLAAFMNLLFLAVAVKRILRDSGGDFPMSPLVRKFGLQCLIALSMGAICLVSNTFLRSVLPDPDGTRLAIVSIRLLRVGLLVTEGIVVIAVLARVFGARDTTEALEFLGGRVRGKWNKIMKSKKNCE